MITFDKATTFWKWTQFSAEIMVFSKNLLKLDNAINLICDVNFNDEILFTSNEE